MWRGDTRGAHFGRWGGLGHGLSWRGHHQGLCVFLHLDVMSVIGHGSILRFITPPRVGVVVYPRVSSQFIGSTEPLGTACELTSMRFLARMGPNVSRLMLQPVESLVAQRAFVGSR